MAENRIAIMNVVSIAIVVFNEGISGEYNPPCTTSTFRE